MFGKGVYNIIGREMINGEDTSMSVSNLHAGSWFGDYEIIMQVPS